jgi:RHS repeat-associated protein
MRRTARFTRRHISARVWLAQFGALALALAVLSLVGLPLAATTIAEADPPPPPSELIQQRTASSRTFDNHDGTYTTSLYSGPVHFREAQGQWRPISSAVVPTTESGYGFENEANRFRTLFKSTLQNDYLALETAGARFRVSLQNAAQVTAQTGPRRVTYPGVFSGVDLRYELRPDGVKETLLLQNAQVPTSYRFLLTPPANARIHAAQGRDGSWAFFMAPHARPVFVIDAPWAAEDDEPDSRRNHASLAVTRVGDVFALDLSVDATWLRASGRQFPVRLDPTITIQPTFQDASFDFACLGCSGVASDRLSIGTGSQGFSANTWRSALQFSLADIPPGATISNAKLKLYFDGTCVGAPGPVCGGTSHQIDALRMTSSWSPSSTTSQLSFDSGTTLASFTLPASAPAQWMNWDITGTVQDWASGGGVPSNFGLLLRRAPESASASGPKPPSRNYAAEPTLGPTLQVTYNGDGGELLEPETVHSNGAELRWIPYAGPGAPPFTSYEVHRSPTSSYTPSDSTRLTRIMDSGVTSYRDTTAKAGATFTYKVIVSGAETNARTVTLPAAGQTNKVLRPDAKRGHDAYYTYRSDLIDCTNRGALERLKVGTDVNSLWRSLAWFDLHDIPSSATVTSATLSLWHPDTSPAALTVRAHRVSAAWDEGNGVDTCTGDGATWYETKGGVRWAADGGDFDPTVVSAVSIPSGQAAAWNSWALTSLVQQWLSGSQPNHGVLLKVDDETIVAGKYLDYYSSDLGVAPTLRPKLSVTYTEANPVIAPTIAIGGPAPSAQVRGSSVPITAGASDDRRVDTVEFFRCSNSNSNCAGGTWVSIGTDSSEPFSTTWNSTSVPNGARSLMARATDDAGNQTSSAAIAVSVGNATPPTTSIFSPANPSNVSGTVTVQANASPGVTKVEFYADGTLFATDTATPWSASWNTLDPALPAYDRMTHALTTKAYDAFGQSTTSAPVSVTPINAQGTKYLADFSSITFPARMESSQQYGFDITVTNRSSLTWADGDIYLRYRWFPIGSTTSLVDSNLTPSTKVGLLLPNGSSSPIHLDVTPPSLPAGLARTDYRLRFDLYTSLSSEWFAARGNKPLEAAVPVGTLSGEEKLGVQHYFEYDQEELGLGMQSLVNVATGNSVIRWTPLKAPGIGLSTNLELTYNSMEGDCTANRCPLGPGWSLSVSGLTRFGHQQFTVDSPGSPSRVTLRDADGTLLEFTSTDEEHWTAPHGTHLYLRETVDQQQWALTSPDGVTYFYAMDGEHGVPEKVTDRKGNQLTFSTNSPAEVYRVGDETDRRIPQIPNRHFDLNYDGKHRQLQWISDHLGHKLRFSYRDDQRLSDIVEEGGTNADGSELPSRSIHFEYETQGPPHPENRQLVSVRDPNQHTTVFEYHGDNRLWKRTNREPNEQATFTYPSGGVTTVTKTPTTAPRVTTFTSDAEGKVTDIARQIGGRTETTTIGWTQAAPLRHVARVTEPHDGSSTPGAYTKYLYNLNGLVTEEAVLVDHGEDPQIEDDDILSRTLYDYDDLPIPGEDPTVFPISQLVKRTDPNGAGTATEGDYEWNYTYDAEGNVETTTDPTGAVTTNVWNGDGTLASVEDANHHTTTYSGYDGNGFATQVVDAKNQTTRYTYDADGLLRSIQNALHANDSGTIEREYKTIIEYDSFHRPGRHSSPKSTRFRRGTLIWTGKEYDPNNNVTVERQPAEAPAGGPYMETEYDFMDRPKVVTGTDRSNGLERTRYQYDAAGRVWRTTQPRGFDTPTELDFVTENTYDRLDRVVTETAYAEDGIGTRKTHHCYQDNTGDLLWMTQPKANLTQAPTNCSEISPPPTPPEYTTRYSYDAAHRQQTVTEPLTGPETRTSEQAYDLNGNVTSETDELGTTTTLAYSQRDELLETVEVFNNESSPPRTLTSLRTYDKVGNLVCEASPRAWDSGSRCDPEAPPGSEQYITEYRYDSVNQLDRIALPDDHGNVRTYIHRQYDSGGNMTLTTLPVENEEFASQPTISDDKKTTIQYFDLGWIYSAWDHVAPIVYYDYRPEGWQSLRAPRSPADERATFWHYFNDGLVREIDDTYSDPGSTYMYDENGNQKFAIERRGRTRKSQTPYTIFSDYNGYDELTEMRYKQEVDSAFWYTNFTYDQNGNVWQRWDNGTATHSGRKHEFDYDESDQTRSDHDWGPDLQPNTGDDQQVAFEYWPTGWQQQRTIDRWDDSANVWRRRQTIDSTYFDNGDPRKVETHNGAAQPALLESHTIEYIDSGIYLNGNRTMDTFRLKGSNGALCDAQDCVTSYAYGPRENLTRETRSRPNTAPGQVRTYGYDLAMNLNHEVDGTTEWWYTHAGNRLTTRRTQPPENPDPNAVNRRYFYDEWGNLNCVTTGGGSSSSCARPFGMPAPGELLESYTWDYLNRLDHSTLFATEDDADYEHDPLNRVARETETHDNGAGNRRTCFTYLGLSSDPSDEAWVGTSDPCTATPSTATSYSYGAYGERVGMKKTGGLNEGDYYYGRNLHTDVSLLEKDNAAGGEVKASYVYKPYGAEDSLSSGDLEGPVTLNAFRFNDKRLDSGSISIDMGARRYAADLGRFIQRDSFDAGQADRLLAVDPILQNRYAFAGSNPCTFIEDDGHRYIDYEINEAERAWCLRSVSNARRCFDADGLADQAREWALILYPASSTQGVNTQRAGEGDAFRHCYWSALMTLQWDAATAKGFGDRHEQLTKEERRERVRDNQKLLRTFGLRGTARQAWLFYFAERRMDWHNNRVGRHHAAHLWTPGKNNNTIHNDESVRENCEFDRGYPEYNELWVLYDVVDGKRKWHPRFRPGS